MVKNPPVNAGTAEDEGSLPGLWRSPEEGNGNPLQYSCLENSMVRGAWWAIVHGVAKSWTWQKRLSTHPLASASSFLLFWNWALGCVIFYLELTPGSQLGRKVDIYFSYVFYLLVLVYSKQLVKETGRIKIKPKFSWVIDSKVKWYNQH